MASQAFHEPMQGRAGDLRLCSSWMSENTRQRPRQAQREAGDKTEATRVTGPALAARTWVEASTRRIGSLADAGERIRTHQLARDISLGADDPGRTLQRMGYLCRRGTVRVRHYRLEDRRSSCHPGEERACSSLGETKGRARLPRQSWDLGLEAIQGMTNSMNAIANQVIRNSGRSGRNAGWPYFDGTFRDYPAFKRKFESFQMTYHRCTPTRELFQQFREMCLPEKLSVKIKSANTMENAWIRLDAWFGDKALFIKDLSCPSHVPNSYTSPMFTPGLIFLVLSGDTQKGV